MVRAIAAVVAGYVVFALSSMLLVSLSMAGRWPLAIAAIVGLVLLGVAVGWLTASIAGTKAKTAALVVTLLIVLATVANLAFSLGVEPVWHKFVTLFVTAPLVSLVALRTQVKSDGA